MITNNNAFLMARGAGSRIEIHAADAEKGSWTQLDATAQEGATQIRLADAQGWQVGDVIAIASTDFDLNQAEERVITSVSPDGRTIGFEEPLEFMHYGEIETYDDGSDVHQLDMRAEVGLLSRNVTIQGDEDAAEDQFGGHTMVMMGAEMYISGAEFFQMGQAGLLGRYATHWHLVGDAAGQYITNSSYHQTYNKGMTIHGTDNTTVTDNVIFETIGHSYFFEDGTETGNVLTGNLGFNTRSADPDNAVIRSDVGQVSTFWVENGDNHLISNHAGGSESSGFWFELTRDHQRDMGVFLDNATHSNDDHGYRLNHGGLIQDGAPFGSAEAPQKVDDWLIDGFTVYKTDLGAYIRGVEGTFVNSAFAELDNNARFRLNQTIEDSLIVGRTGNLGTPDSAAERAAGRSLPDDDNDLNGFQFYDGPGALKNVHFDGFEGDDEAIYLSNAIHKTVAFGFEEVTFGDNVDESQKLSISGGGRSISNDSWARGFVDVDGSITGTPGAVVRQLDGRGNLFNAGADFEIRDDWGAVISYGTTPGTLTIDDRGNAEDNDGKNNGWNADNKAVTRSDGVRAEDLREQIPVFTDGSFTYELDFDRGPDQFRLYLHDTGWGESVIFNLGPVPETSSFTVDDPYSDAARPAREVSSMAMLEASPDTAVFRDASGEVHIKLVAEMAHGYLWPQPGTSFQDKLLGGVTVLVDQEADLDLTTLTYDDPRPGDTLGPPPLAEAPDVATLEDVLTHVQGNRDAGIDTGGLPRWSDPEVWGGTLPGAGDVVVIDDGLQLVLDVSTTVGGIIVQGEGSALIIEDAPGTTIDLTADWILINEGATFQAGTEEDPLDTDFTLTLSGDNPDFDLDFQAHLDGTMPETVFAAEPPERPEETPQPPAPREIAQTGKADINATNDSDWHRIDFDTAMEDPVVVANMLSRNGAEPAVLRVRNVSEDGFEVLIEEWEYLDGQHVSETVAWLAVERGVHRFEDGTVIEAGTIEADHTLTDVSFEADFGGDGPVVLAQVASHNGHQTVAERISDVDADGFSVLLQEEEALRPSGHLTEQLHFIAASEGSHEGFSAGRFETTEGTQAGSPPDWEATLAPDALHFADMQTRSGPDTAGLRYDADQGSWRIEEETSQDGETRHVSETIGWFSAGAMLT
ncbi:MAG: G8 domain-containing protein [Pseudomonadota bacterium]